jgi:phosphatidylserine decarboxylase
MQRIPIYNRYRKTVEAEQIYGERALRWAYETGLGRLALGALLVRPWLSRWYGWRMSQASSAARIAPFIRDYELDRSEFLEDPASFSSFNAFFTRRLKPEARPVDPDPASLVFPADGRHLLLEDLSREGVFYLKGHRLGLASLIGQIDGWEVFGDGSAVISRLCPVDYHRFHFPCGGEWETPRRLPGPLYSVNPIALSVNPGALWENRRWVSRVRPDSIPGAGLLMVEIGATFVGSVTYTARSGRCVSKGEEKGFFSFGGSCVVTLFPRGSVRFAGDLVEQSRQGRELFARMGDRLGTFVQA